MFENHRQKKQGAFARGPKHTLSSPAGHSHTIGKGCQVTPGPHVLLLVGRVPIQHGRQLLVGNQVVHVGTVGNAGLRRHVRAPEYQNVPLLSALGLPTSRYKIAVIIPWVVSASSWNSPLPLPSISPSPPRRASKTQPSGGSPQPESQPASLSLPQPLPSRLWSRCR